MRVAINGYGRIGRCLLRALYESQQHEAISLVAINDLAPPEALAHLTQYDSLHGTFPYPVELRDQTLRLQGDTLHLFAERDARQLPWQDLGVDLIFECTGRYTHKEKAVSHLQAGAKKVLISAPGQGSDHTVVYGVNHTTLHPDHRIVSNASCTTNCLAPLLKIVHVRFQIQQGMMTTVHSDTSDQMLVDGYHKDLRRARAAPQAMIPTSTGATAAVGLVLPELAGKLVGMALRGPTPNVSLVDLTLTLTQQVTTEDIHKALQHITDGALARVVATNDKPLVSVDFNHTQASCIVDLLQTQVVGNMVKLLAWYDNEWGFAHRMLDVALLMYD